MPTREVRVVGTSLSPSPASSWAVASEAGTVKSCRARWFARLAAFVPFSVGGQENFAINRYVGKTTSMNRVSVENPDDDDDRVYLTRPVTTLRLSPLLGIKPHVILVELMKRKVFAGLRDI